MEDRAEKDTFHIKVDQLGRGDRGVRRDVSQLQVRGKVEVQVGTHRLLVVFISAPLYTGWVTLPSIIVKRVMVQ